MQSYWPALYLDWLVFPVWKPNNNCVHSCARVDWIQMKQNFRDSAQMTKHNINKKKCLSIRSGYEAWIIKSFFVFSFSWWYRSQCSLVAPYSSVGTNHNLRYFRNYKPSRTKHSMQTRPICTMAGILVTRIRMCVRESVKKITLDCVNFINKDPTLWPASWSSGQSLWLLIMRSRVRFPALPWEFT